MATWYVRPDDSHGGANDGTSYADAWQGASEIVWASLDGTDDTLYVCGAWGAGFTCTASGLSRDRRLKIRGDYSADPCTITFATVRTWTGPDANGEYACAGLADATTPLVVDHGVRCWGWNVGSQQRQLSWTVDAATNVITCNPSTNNTRTFADGDRCAFREGSGTLPSGLDESTWYYMRDVTSNSTTRTFKVALTEGGDAIDIGALTGTCELLLRQSRYQDPVQGSLQPGEYAWDYPTRTMYFKPYSAFDASQVLVALTNTGSGGISVATQDYVQVRGFTILGARTLYVIDLDGGTGNEARDNTVTASDGGIVVSGGGTKAHLHDNVVSDIGWHAYGSMDSGDAETGMLCEYNIARNNGRKHDLGDTQMFVTSRESTGAVWRFNIIEDSGRQHVETNSGIFVCDNSGSMLIYGNRVSRCFGKVFQIGIGSGGFDNVRFLSNIIEDHNPGGPTSADDFTTNPDWAFGVSALIELDWRDPGIATVLGSIEIAGNTIVGGNFYADTSVANSTARRSGVFAFRGAGTPTTNTGPITIQDNVVSGVVGSVFEITGTTLANFNVVRDFDFIIGSNRYYDCSRIARGSYGTSGAPTMVFDYDMTELADWAAYTIGDTDSTVGDPELTEDHRPKSASPIIGSGVHIGYFRDFDGVQRFNPPTIGAYELPRARGTASAREPRV